MIDHDIIDYIRDAMLADPYIDAATVYAITEIAHDNFDTFFLMCRWMKEVNPDLKDVYFSNLVANVEFYRGIDRESTKDFYC